MRAMRRTCTFSPTLATSHARFLDGRAVRGLLRLERLDAGGAAAQRGLGHFIGELDEVLVLGDEVGFGVDFDEHGLAAVLGEHDAAFRGDAAGLLVGLGEALLAQPLGGGVDVAVVFGERLLAFHHAGASALAQILDQRCGDFHGVPHAGAARCVARFTRFVAPMRAGTQRVVVKTATGLGRCRNDNGEFAPKPSPASAAAVATRRFRRRAA
jgi:hypothetical protein